MADKMVTSKVEGMEHLERQLEKVASSLNKDKLEPVMLRLAEKVAERIRQKAPIGPTGNLSRSPFAKLMPRKEGYPVIAIAGIDRKIAPHAHLVEFGTSKMPPHPFFRPAVDESQAEIMGNIENECKDLVEKSV